LKPVKRVKSVKRCTGCTFATVTTDTEAPSTTISCSIITGHYFLLYRRVSCGYSISSYFDSVGDIIPMLQVVSSKLLSSLSLGHGLLECTFLPCLCVFSPVTQSVRPIKYIARADGLW
jgi:hypothetical protein